MGENGAGKSTLMKILSGAYVADSGTIRIDGCDIRNYGVNDAKRHGISVIYQELSLCANMSVVENIYLGREIRRCGVINRKAMTEGALVVLKRLGVTFDPHALVGTLSIADQQLVEIARAIHADTRILVMDEPTTPLSTKETESLFTLIRQLRDDGVAIIYISHRMAEIYALSDFVSVLRDGHYVGSLDRVTLLRATDTTCSQSYRRLQNSGLQFRSVCRRNSRDCRTGGFWKNRTCPINRRRRCVLRRKD
jgi:ribose transport system ATP-binding protein